jgi:uncharacterized protein (TIGR04255 family)
MSDNQHLAEVLCSVWFNPEENEWDSTFFGKFYDVVISRGYTEKKEQKIVEVKVETQNKNANFSEGKPRMIFTNNSLKAAITISDHFVSFHKLAPYENWSSLISEIAIPGLEMYRNIGLGKGKIREVQCLYLNRYEYYGAEKIAKRFKFLPDLPQASETNIFFQARYDISETGFVQLKLNGNRENEILPLYFECSSYIRNSDPRLDFLALSKQAHDVANDVYEKIVNN